MRVLIDACVLFPTVPREIILGCARAGLLVPLWSDRILEEWRRAVLRACPQQAEQVAAEIALTRLAFAQASVPVSEDVEARLSLPDANDRHVLAAAITGGADLLVTRNLRDFPPRTLARHGVRVAAPDALLLELWHDDPGGVRACVDPVLAPILRDLGAQPRDVLKRAGLPRLAKALARTV